MSAPMESTAFCSVLNEIDFLSVAEGYTDDTVIISSKRKLFDVYKISDQKSLKSWSVRHGVTLTSPVVWNAHLEKFVTVVNNQDVRTWDTDNTDFEKSKKRQSSTKIYKVMCVGNWEPVILFDNGNVDFLSGIKDDHGKGPLTNKQDIHWCTTVSTQSTLMVVYTVITQKGIELHTQKFDTDNTLWRHTMLDVPKPHKKGTLCSCDSIVHSDTVTVFFLWTGGKLSSLNIHEGRSTSGPCHTVPGINKNSSILAVDDYHIAVAGITENNVDGLGIFDTKFGLLKSWQPFPDKCICKPKMFKVKDNLFLPCSTTLYRYKFECEPSTLVSILGQAKTAENIDSQSVPGHYTWKTSMKRPMSKPSLQVSALLTTLKDSSLSYEKFKLMFDQLINHLRKIENLHWLSASHMTALVQRMMGEKKFWAKEEMSQLIALKCIPLSNIEELMSFLIKKSEITMLHTMLQTLPNIPEKCLCKALSFFIQCDEEKLPTVEEMEVESPEDECSEDESREKPHTCPITPGRSAVVDEILSLPYSDTFLLECLRKVSFKDSLKLLEYLCFLLETKSGFSEARKEKKLSQIQVVDWLCLVLDAHITQFVLSPDCHVTVVKLESIVRKQVEFFDGLVTLEALLEHFKVKTSLPEDKKVGQYCIEVLHVY